MRSHVIVAGAGILGLATAAELIRRGHTVTVLEKESGIAQHQTGNNSGVIHSGLYYKPGSLKAKLGTAGATSMRRFAEEHGVPVEICGKLVVATELSQVPAAPGAPPTRPGQRRAVSDDQFRKSQGVRAARLLRSGVAGLLDRHRRLSRASVRHFDNRSSRLAAKSDWATRSSASHRVQTQSL